MNWQELKELLHYAPETGVFTRKKDKGNRKKGEVAGTPHNHGYWKVSVNSRQYLAHRLAFFYMTGEWPKEQIDHRNRDKRDNRWCNLREATHAQNMQNCKISKNNKSGFKGVTIDKHGSWYAHIMIDRKLISLGSHKTAEEAHETYCKAADRLHGEFANHGT